MADWLFQKKRISLPAADYGLDEDGWIDVRTRVTARDYDRMSAGGSQLGYLSDFVLGWQLKVEGQEIPFDKDTVLDLPLEMLTAAAEAITASPLVAKALGLNSGQNGSPDSTSKSGQGSGASNRPRKSAKHT